jgi:hypothetical protein
MDAGMPMPAVVSLTPMPSYGGTLVEFVSSSYPILSGRDFREHSLTADKLSGRYWHSPANGALISHFARGWSLSQKICQALG